MEKKVKTNLLSLLCGGLCCCVALGVAIKAADGAKAEETRFGPEKYVMVNIACDQVIDVMWNSVNNGAIQGQAPMRVTTANSHVTSYTLTAGTSVNDEAFINRAVDNYAKYFRSAYLSAFCSTEITTAI